MKKIYWVEIKEFINKLPIVRLPKGIFEKKSYLLNGLIGFGVNQERFVSEESNIDMTEASNYFNPITIEISSELINKLYIPTNIIYQMKFNKESIEIGPTIGFLLGDRSHLYNPKYMEKFNDRFGVYSRVGGLIIAFSSRSIDWQNNRVFGLIYNHFQEKWEYGSASIPSVIYRRNFHQDQENIQKIKKITNGKLFNDKRFTKLEIYDQLKEHKRFKKYLPETYLLSDFQHMLDFIDEKEKIIIKPNNLSRGRGILIVQKVDDSDYYLRDYRNKEELLIYSFNKQELFQYLNQNYFINGEYIYQTYIPLAKVHGSPFDIRIVMQKDYLSQWQCNGIECRIAYKGEDITNISRGGRAMKLIEVIDKLGSDFKYEKIEEDILSVSELFCNLMDDKGHYFEFGIDIGLDQKGGLWFIEANVFPSFKGFQKIKKETYTLIRHHVLFYATSIQGFQINREGSN